MTRRRASITSYPQDLQVAPVPTSLRHVHKTSRGKLALTVDLEWYYNGNESGSVSDFADRSLSERFAYDDGQIVRSVDTILEILAAQDSRITFFTVAELDLVHAPLLARIESAGHEIGVHSYRHDELGSEEDIERDLAACQPFKEKYQAVSYRAPRISGRRSLYPLLRKFGYQYDSSLYGTRHLTEDGIEIIPVSVLPITSSQQIQPGNMKAVAKQITVPIGSGMAGGLGLRLYDHLLSSYRRRVDETPCTYLHSWQISQPSYTFKFMRRYPYMYPYSRECTGLLVALSERYELIPLKGCKDE